MMGAQRQSQPDAQAPNEPTGLTKILQLERQIRHASDVAELGFRIVNLTKHVVPYQQAALWFSATGEGTLAALSGLAVLDPNAPYVVWISQLLKELAAHPEAHLARAFDSTAVSGNLANEWADWLPLHALWVPLNAPDGSRMGGLLLAREQPWTKAEVEPFAFLADAYGHAWSSLVRHKGTHIGTLLRTNRTRVTAWVAGSLFVLAWLPVRQSVLAPAEVVPLHPFIIRAPVDGVVDRVLVRPNQEVRKGQLLMGLDPVRVRSQLAIAQKQLDVALAQYRSDAELAVTDLKSRSELAVLDGKIREEQAEVNYNTELLKRADIRSPREGVAIFDDPNEWIGKPMVMGERLMMVADPKDVTVEIRLPVADMIDLSPGANTYLFLNVDPGHAIPAKLSVIGYEATVASDGLVTYRLMAAFTARQPDVHAGLRGTAKIDGGRTVLAYYLFRRPIAVVRQWLGL